VFGCDGAPQGPLMQRCPGHAEGMTDPSVHGGATELGRFLRARHAEVTAAQVARALNSPASGVATTYAAIPEDTGSTMPKSVTSPLATKA
jgi:hypothetical protein